MRASKSPNYWYDKSDFTIKSNDPNVWIRFFFPDYRMRRPARFVLHIDDRDIGFSISEKPTVIELKKRTKRPDYQYSNSDVLEFV